MRSGFVLFLLVCGLGAGFVVGEHLSGEEASATRLLRAWIAAAPATAPAGPRADAPPPTPAPGPPEAPREEPPSTAIEIVAGGEASIVEDTPGGFVAEPIPLYRYLDPSGAIHMVEGLANVPPQHRHSAAKVSRDAGRINRVDIPPSSRSAFRDWEPEFNANRGGVILFSAAGCGACSRARQHLDRLGVAYEIRDIHSDSSAKDYVRRILGRVVVPLLKVGPRHVSGYLPDEYDRLARRG